MNNMAKTPIVLLLITLAVCEALWPGDGVHYCDEIVHAPTAANCTTCFRAAIQAPSDITLTENCITQYMPPSIAKCARLLRSSRKTFHKCVKKAARSQSNLDQRTRHLYTKAGAMLDVVLTANTVPNAPEALLSCMAQNILLYSDELKNTLRNVASECWDRFKLDPKNAQWHLNSGKPWRNPVRSLPDGDWPLSSGKPQRHPVRSLPYDMPARNLTYQYGIMGHDMPFHGVGALAVDYLKGECVVRDMVKHDRKTSGTSLQNLVDTLLKHDAPVPAWLFREMMTNIELISLS